MTSYAVLVDGVCVVGKSYPETLSFVAKTIAHAKTINISISSISVAVDNKQMAYTIYEGEELPDDLTAEGMMLVATCPKFYTMRASYKSGKAVQQEDDENDTIVVPMSANGTVHVKPLSSMGHCSTSVVYDRLDINDGSRGGIQLSIQSEISGDGYASYKDYSQEILLARQLVSAVHRMSVENINKILESKIRFISPEGKPEKKYRLGVSAENFSRTKSRLIKIFL